MTPETLLEAVTALALAAGEAIMTVYRTDFDVQRKADHSPVTEADLAAHHIIDAGLRRLTPDLPRLCEEGALPAHGERRAWTRFWLIDPLDGTREFVKRNGEFTVNIALVEDGAPVLGVVFAPALGDTYLAARGVGAWKRDAQGQRELHTRRVGARPVVAMSRSHHDEETEALFRPIGRYDRAQRGSSLKFGLVAEGSADLYARLGPTSEWDTAAGQCVAEQSGGVVLTLPHYAPMRYNQRDTLINPGFVVYGDRGFDWPAKLGPAS